MKNAAFCVCLMKLDCDEYFARYFKDFVSQKHGAKYQTVERYSLEPNMQIY
jgi:hypothetical protein